MRDIISNDTLARIAKTVDEIIVNIGNNIKSIEQPVGALEGDTVLFTYKDYNGTVKTVTVNDIRFFISDEPLGVYDYKYSDVVRHNKYVYIRIADKSGFYLEGNRNREYEPNAKMTWEQDGHSFNEDGYFGKLKREQYDNPQWSNDQYLQYCLFGLEIGKTYTFSFSAQFQLPQYDEHPSDHVAGGTNSKPFGLLFSSQEYVSAELIESLPENRGVWNPAEHFQSFYDDVDTSHTYTCTFTADSSIVSESGITYLTFVFTAASYRYKIDFFWGSFKTAEGIDILSKHIFWDDSWFNLGAGGGGGGTSDLDAIELTYAEYQALTPAEKTDPDKIYFITDYPGGSGVVINPAGSATDTAETIEVDGTIYDFKDADAVHTADIGVAGGVAELDSNGKVPSSQLPSYVDDVEEYASISTFPATGESGKIYIALDTNKTYRWTGSVYVEISPSLALGETSSTAYRGDRGKTAYDHSQSDHSRIAPAFTEASTRANIASGETFATLLGKIKKFFSDLKAVAFSGSYNDLSDKPTIPTVNNGTLTIQKNGSNVATFTANQSGNSTANITVPTKVSELTNDSGYTTNTGTVTQVKVGSTAYDPSSGVVSLPAYPTNTDEKVKQENTTTSADYRVLFSNGANDTTETKTARKSTNLKFNPSTGNLQATQLNGVTIGSSPKFTDTNTKVTSSANHYTPSTASGSDKTASASGATAAWSIDVVKGVTLNTDGKGHVTGLSVTSGKIPANPNTDTKVTQTATTTNANYEVLFSSTADDTTRTEGARKCSEIKANPSTGLLYSKGLAVNNGQVTTVYGVDTITHNNKAISLPSSAGTLALTSQIPSVPSQAETARRSKYTMSTKGAWTAASYSSSLPSSYGHAIILIYYTISGITCLMSETRVTKAEWEACASPNIMMPFVSSPPNDAYGVYLQYVSTSQFKYYVGSGLQGDWSVVIKTTVV